MNLDYLDFEQPIAVLEAKIEELQLASDDNALNIAAEIATLREKSRKLTESICEGPISILSASTAFSQGTATKMDADP